MRKDISNNRKFLIERLGILRNKAGLSARELSGRLGFSIAYIAKFENGDFSIPAEVLLDAIEICGSTPEEFFSEDIFTYKENKEIIEAYTKLSPTGKTALKEIMRNMK